ncbi:hypothetical protein Pyn_13098 [Prunus yedoensis var. nudiflora]|uniref:Uncharacterized protein n=1 Tax=Prunus yedoensis var. nudiflora TaxID=2094558 RepID=A0A314Y334_PRUYE|nr:hypothetical protein Pyn_13098 [Prunus yedoensis var. nudiflora]
MQLPCDHLSFEARNYGANADQNVADLDFNGGDFNTKQAHEKTNFETITAAAPEQSAENGCKIEVCENKKTTMKEKKTSYARIGTPAAKKTSHKENFTLQRKCERERSKEAKKVEKLRAAKRRRAEMKEKKIAISSKNRGTNGDPARHHGGNADQNAADLDDNGGDFNTKQAHKNTNFKPITAAAPDQSAENGCKKPCVFSKTMCFFRMLF